MNGGTQRLRVFHEFGTRKSVTSTTWKSGFLSSSRRSTNDPRMAPTPGEEGLGRRAGSFDLFGAFIPRDPRGIVLACGFLGAAGLGVNALFLGDWIGFAYFAGAGVGYFFLQTRLVPASIWLAIAGGGVAGASAGDASDWVVAGLGAFLALLSLLPPAVESEPGSSRKPEVRRAGQPIGPNL